METIKKKGREVVLQERDAIRAHSRIILRDTILMGQPRD